MRWCTTGRPPLERLIGDFDLLHVLYPSTPVPTSSPSVVTLHDLMPITHPDWFARYERWAFERALRHLQRHTGLVIADSSAVADEAVRLLGLDRGRIRVVHLGVAGDFVARPAPGRRHTPTGSDPTGSDPTDDDQQQQRAVLARHGLEPGRYVVALGSISVRKNTTVLLDAWPTVAARHPDLRLVLVGPAGPDGPAIIERARRLGERVRITGWLPADEVAAVVRAALALAQPSLAEGFGMTPLEAMAAGVPVIVSSEGSLSEVVGDAAMRVPALDPPAWAEAIGRLADDDGLCAGLVAAGRARAAAFTWERTAARTVEVYREALGR
jgi:glycosyltransferase involved in cell wall biosynthesis